MQNSTSTMIAMFIAGILLFIVPLVTLTDRNDNVTQENVKLIVEEFVTEIRNTGEFTRTKYQDFSNKLYSIGSNTYEIEIEIKYLDENPGKKTMQANYTKIGENVYYSEYTTQILKKIGIKVDEDTVTEEDDTIKLKEGDIVYVAVRNEDSTTAQTLKSSFLSFSNAGEYVISASSAAMVTVNADGKITEEVTQDEMLNYEYKITYNANGGTGALGFQGKSYGVDINITNVKPTRTGYNFLGWSTNPTSQEVIYNPGDMFSINANITLYAVWEIKTFTIMYNANGGIGAPASQIKTWGIDLRLSTQSLTRTGYTFLGWSTNYQATTPEYEPGGMFTTNATTTLFAVWKPHKYTISYDANGGTNAPESQIKTHDIILTLTSLQPSRTGYTFLGWSTNRAATSAEYLPGAIFTTEANTVLYAIWKIDTYKITYNANGGTGAPQQQIKTYGIDLELSMIEPTKTGYTFLGWNTDSTATTATYKAGGKFTINADTTLYAIWEINKYTIKYDANRGTGAPANQTKTYGIDLILSSTQPTRTGYTFLGWSVSSTATSPTYISGATYTDNLDVTLYAVWRINTYAINYNANGGIGAPEEQTKTYGIDLTLSTTKPTREGYTFLGWDTNKTATTVKYTAGGTYTSNEHVTLYAVWDLNKYTISYNENGGTGAPEAQIKTHGVDLTLSRTQPTKTGYTFLGWSTNKNATTASYIAGGTFTTNADTTLYAIWKINTYTITYDANQGSGAPASQTKTYGIDLTLSTSKPTRAGYTFLGWSTTSNASTYTYEAGGTFNKNEDTTLFAVWEINKYTISYDPNGGIGEPSAQTKIHGVDLTLSSTEPTREGYTFLGWSKSSTADTATYAKGATFTENKDTYLYAVWQVATYTVTYNANGGSGNNASVSRNIGTSLTLEGAGKFEAPSGKHFFHWNTKADGTGTSYEAEETYTANRSVILYAIWKTNTYTVSYNANGGSGEPAAQTKTYGVNLTLSSTKPTRAGHTFQGWGISESDTTVDYEAGGSYTANSGATLYAIWKANTYTVAYNGNGHTGGSTASSSHTYGIAKNLTANGFTKTGYDFSGWATSASGAVAYSNQQSVTNLSETQDETVTLYAKWTPKTYTVSYNANGGSGEPAAQTKTYGVNLTLSSTKPTKSGYTFQGWGTSSTDTTVDYAAGATYSANSAITLYAIWRVNSFYAIQSGSLVACPNAYAWTGGHSSGSGTNSDSSYYGGWGHTNGESGSWGASTGALSTNGCPNLTIGTYVNNWGEDYPSATLTVKSGSTTIYTTSVANQSYSTSRTIDISAYSTVTIQINCSCDSGQDGNGDWMAVGLTNIRFHD